MLRSTRYYMIRAACDRACSRCTPLCFRTERIIHTATHRNQNREIFLAGKAIMTDALHWVVAIWVGFATKSVKSATAISTTFVAALRCGVRSGIKHSSPAAQGIVPISTTVLVVLYACVCSLSQQRQQGCAIFLRGSSSRGRFCSDVEAGMGRGEQSV